MKKEKFNKKLALNKLTIVNLGDGEMRQINGMGITDTCPPLPSWDSYCASICPIKCPPPPYTLETWCICYTIDYGC